MTEKRLLNTELLGLDILIFLNRTLVLHPGYLD